MAAAIGGRGINAPPGFIRTAGGFINRLYFAEIWPRESNSTRAGRLADRVGVAINGSAVTKLAEKSLPNCFGPAW